MKHSDGKYAAIRRYAAIRKYAAICCEAPKDSLARMPEPEHTISTIAVLSVRL